VAGQLKRGGNLARTLSHVNESSRKISKKTVLKDKLPTTKKKSERSRVRAPKRGGTRRTKAKKGRRGCAKKGARLQDYLIAKNHLSYGGKGLYQNGKNVWREG